MPVISSTNSASPSLQASLNSARLQQARQEADQAERVAQDLRSQATQAEIDASKGQEKVRQLSSSDPTYSAARNTQAAEVAPKTQDFLLRMYTATSQKFAASGNALKTNPDAPPVVNTRGQTTGRIVNIKA